MSRILILSCLTLAAVTAGGCSYRFDPRVEETTSIGALERVERSRATVDRMHPACRDGRTDRDQQPEGCDVLVRRH